MKIGIGVAPGLFIWSDDINLKREAEEKRRCEHKCHD